MGAGTRGKERIQKLGEWEARGEGDGNGGGGGRNVELNQSYLSGFVL